MSNSLDAKYLIAKTAKIDGMWSKKQIFDHAALLAAALNSRLTVDILGEQSMFTCDGCGKIVEEIDAFRGSGSVGAEALRTALQAVGWSTTPQGEDYCAACNRNSDSPN